MCLMQQHPILCLKGAFQLSNMLDINQRRVTHGSRSQMYTHLSLKILHKALLMVLKTSNFLYLEIMNITNIN